MRALAAEVAAAAGDAAPAYVAGKDVSRRFRLSKVVANAAVRFLTRAGVLNTHPSLAFARARGGSDVPLDATALAAEAAIASGALQRPRVTAEEATPLPPGVFTTAGRSVRLISNKAGFKGVRPAKNGCFVAELFVGPERYTLGTFATAVEAAEAYDRGAARRACAALLRTGLTRLRSTAGCLRVHTVTQPAQLNFPLARYAQFKAEPLPPPDAAGAQASGGVDASLLCAAGDPDAPPSELAGAGFAPDCGAD